ncbi:MAG: heavy metal sensor histidine kinase [Proteobacteria bacterium]|nr:heavy metal sensor histidine kinase [Pseudomonadota bacterium]
MKILKSLVGRLTCLYLFFNLILLVSIGFVLYFIGKESMLVGAKQYLVDEVYIIQSLLNQAPGDLDFILGEINGVPEALKNASYHYFIKITKTDKKLFIKTPGFPEELNENIFPRVNVEKWEKQIRQVRVDNKNYLLISAPIVINKLTGSTGFIYVALDITYHEFLINQFIKILLLIIVVGAMFSAVFGYFLSSKGISPLQKIVMATEKIEIDKLNLRIDYKKWPAELEVVASEFNKMLDRIEQAVNTLSRCVMELAHEIRTPIHNLIGETDYILTKQRSTAEYQHVLESNLEEYRRLSEIIDSILFLARSSEPKRQLTFSSFSVQDEVKHILEFYDAIAVEKNITVACNGYAELNADLTLFRRVIQNILSNAFRYAKDNGYVCVDINRETSESINIVISDNGIGMSEKDLSHIFEYFYRSEESKLVYPEGVGLGLTIVKTIMELHQGSINIKSIPNKGTQVTLLFPI